MPSSSWEYSAPGLRIVGSAGLYAVACHAYDGDGDGLSVAIVSWDQLVRMARQIISEDQAQCSGPPIVMEMGRDGTYVARDAQKTSTASISAIM